MGLGWTGWAGLSARGLVAAAVVRGKDDFGVVGWYHKVREVVDPDQYKTVCERSTRAEVRRWRHA